MSSLRERVDQVLPTLRERGIASMRAWCRLADVAETYLNRRMHSPGSRPDFQAFERLARVAGVDARWLAYGDDPPAGEHPSPALDRATADPPPPPSRASALLRAVWESAHRIAGTDPEDYEAAKRAATESAQYLDADGDVAGFAESLLRAAISLRRDGRAANTAAILTRVAAGRTFGAEAAYATPNEAVERHLDARAAASGLARGERRAQGERVGAEIARKRAKTRGR